MPDILHRISIDAPAAQVHELIATADGIARWWTGRPLDGSTAIDGEFGLFFGDDAEKAAAVMQVVTDTPEEITWRCERGPDSWVGTTITFAIRPNGDDRTTLLFTHAGWAEATEFMHGCTTNWGAYLTSLKTGAETGRFTAFPQGEISRWS
jgi:uncharacterized protein YndB with AHSA1/START domain